MPPRKSASPAPARKSPAASEGAVKASPGRSAKSPARASAAKNGDASSAKKGAASAAKAEASSTPSNGSPAAAASSNGSSKPASNGAAAPATPSRGGGDCAMLMGLAVTVVALLAGAALYPLKPSAPPRKVGPISPNAFNGLEVKAATDGYDGSRLIIFTADKKSSDCEPCAALDKELLNTKAFQAKYGAWFASRTLRIGKVYCSQYAELCERFGVTGSDASVPGVPHILWFKGNKEKGAYDGDRTLEGLTQWVLEKQDKGLL